MSDDLESLLRRAVKGGLLTFSIDREWNGKNWVVSYRNDSNLTITIARDPDPVKALAAGLRKGTKDGKQTLDGPGPKRRRDLV